VTGQDLTVFVCAGGHAFFVSREGGCPRCGGPLTQSTEPAVARLVVTTTVRVTPSGRPFVLGLAQTRSGARTLCLVDEASAGDAVQLALDGDCFRARRAGS